MIFSSSQTGDEHLLTVSGMNTDEMVFEEYLKQIQSGQLEKQILREDVELTKDDRIITLSTCENGGQDDKRYVVQAVLKSVEYF